MKKSILFLNMAIAVLYGFTNDIILIFILAVILSIINAFVSDTGKGFLIYSIVLYISTAAGIFFNHCPYLSAVGTYPEEISAFRHMLTGHIIAMAAVIAGVFVLNRFVKRGKRGELQ